MIRKFEPNTEVIELNRMREEMKKCLRPPFPERREQ